MCDVIMFDKAPLVSLSHLRPCVLITHTHTLRNAFVGRNRWQIWKLAGCVPCVILLSLGLMTYSMCTVCVVGVCNQVLNAILVGYKRVCLLHFVWYLSPSHLREIGERLNWTQSCCMMMMTKLYNITLFCVSQSCMHTVRNRSWYPND